ncbi:MAG: Ig-like domain-containing protein [Euryarchaeota archaeon]|nr:Ig-like domain-containing protein [Euryarchaeota archaeon]
MKKKMYMYIGAITIVIAGLLITSTTCMGGNISTSGDIRSNQPPVAVNDHQFVWPGSVNNKIYVLLNDYDPEGDTITIVSVTQPSHGVASIVGNYVVYTPAVASPTGTWAGHGFDSFTYTINDGFPMPSHFVTATVYLTVGSPLVHNPASDAIYHNPSGDTAPIDDGISPTPIP